jgi:hypothetical protein
MVCLLLSDVLVAAGMKVISNQIKILGKSIKGILKITNR